MRPPVWRLLIVASNDLTLVSMVLRLMDLKKTITFIVYIAGGLWESVKHTLSSNMLKITIYTIHKNNRMTFLWGRYKWAEERDWYTEVSFKLKSWVINKDCTETEVSETTSLDQDWGSSLTYKHLGSLPVESLPTTAIVKACEKSTGLEILDLFLNLPFLGNVYKACTIACLP